MINVVDLQAHTAELKRRIQALLGELQRLNSAVVVPATDTALVRQFIALGYEPQRAAATAQAITAWRANRDAIAVAA